MLDNETMAKLDEIQNYQEATEVYDSDEEYFSSCWGCTGSCSGDCADGCVGACSGECTDGCVGACSGSCTDGCVGDCSGGCKDSSR